MIKQTANGYAYAYERTSAGNNAGEGSLMTQHILSKHTLLYAAASGKVQEPRPAESAPSTDVH